MLNTLAKFSRQFAALLAAAAIGFAVAPLVLRPPPRPECVKGTAEYDPKEKHCELPVSLWERTTGDPLAYYTALLTAFTGILAAVGFGQGVLIFKQIQLGRDEFISTHRPRLVVRGVNVVADDEEQMIVFAIVNTGGTEASVAESRLLFEILGPRDQIRIPESTGFDDLGKVKFGPGQVTEHRHSLTLADQLTMQMSKAAYGGGFGPQGIYFTGNILYADRAGVLRRSVFRRRYHPGDQAFVRLDDPDMEFAD